MRARCALHSLALNKLALAAVEEGCARAKPLSRVCCALYDPRAGASTAQLLDGVQQLLDLFLAKGFALKGLLTPGPGADAFTVRLEGPANLWSLQV